MTPPVIWLGIAASMVLLWAAQEWFRKEYLRRYHPTRLDDKWHAVWGVNERSMLFRALTHRDADPRIERVRRVTIALLVVASVVFVSLNLVRWSLW